MLIATKKMLTSADQVFDIGRKTMNASDKLLVVRSVEEEKRLERKI